MQPTVNFVVPFSDAVIAELRGGDPDALARSGGDLAVTLAMGGPIAWCYLTYSRLKAAGMDNVAMAGAIDRAAINVVHSEHLAQIDDTAGAFIVSAQADHPRRLGAHFHVVQNRNQVKANTVWIHHWPQPGLVGRTTPIERVRRVAYVGQTYNGNLALDVGTWQARCSALGIDFAAPTSGAWYDLSGYDACVAIRSFDRRPYDNKPASKLINAWLAGVPLIGGYDSAYAQIGTPGEDYLLADSMDQVLEWLARLDRDPALRSALVARCHERAAQFTNAAIAQLWLRALEGPIQQRFARWQTSQPAERLRQTALTSLDRSFIGAKKAAWAMFSRFGLSRFGQ